MGMRKLIAVFLCVGAAASVAQVRLISTSPEVTEIVFQLGKGSDLIATSQFSNYPKAAEKLPILGPMNQPSLERTLSFAPTGILLDSTLRVPLYESEVQALRFRSFTFQLANVTELFQSSVRFLNSFYGVSSTPELENEKRKWNALTPLAHSFSYIGFVWDDPPTLFGGATFLSSLLTKLNGTNLAQQILLPYPQISKEWLIAQRPDVVFYLAQGAMQTPKFSAQVHALWPENPPRIFVLDSEQYARASFTPLHHLSELEKQLAP